MEGGQCDGDSEIAGWWAVATDSGPVAAVAKIGWMILSWSGDDTTLWRFSQVIVGFQVDIHTWAGDTIVPSPATQPRLVDNRVPAFSRSVVMPIELNSELLEFDSLSLSSPVKVLKPSAPSAAFPASPASAPTNLASPEDIKASILLNIQKGTCEKGRYIK